MPQYTVVKPIAVDVKNDNGEVVSTKHYPRAGVVIELSAAEAKEFLDQGRIEAVKVEEPAEEQSGGEQSGESADGQDGEQKVEDPPAPKRGRGRGANAGD